MSTKTMKKAVINFELKNKLKRNFILNDQEEIFIGCKLLKKSDTDRQLCFNSECLEENHALLYFEQDQVKYTHLVCLVQ